MVMVAGVAIWPVIWVIVNLSNNKLANKRKKHKDEKVSSKRTHSIRSSSNR
jgi:hypothetical protein